MSPLRPQTHKELEKTEQMTFAIRKELLKAAFDDAETRRKLLDPEISWNDMEKILVEFVEKHGFKVARL